MWVPVRSELVTVRSDLITTVSPFAIHARSTDVSQGKGLVIVPTETALVVGTYSSETAPANETIQALCELSKDLAKAGFWRRQPSMLPKRDKAR